MNEQQNNNLEVSPYDILEYLKEEISPKVDKIEGIETRLGGVETRLGGVETRLGGVETRLGGVENRLDKVENRLDNIEEKMVTKKDFAEFRSEILMTVDQFVKLHQILDQELVFSRHRYDGLEDRVKKLEMSSAAA